MDDDVGGNFVKDSDSRDDADDTGWRFELVTVSPFEGRDAVVAAERFSAWDGEGPVSLTRGEVQGTTVASLSCAEGEGPTPAIISVTKWLIWVNAAHHECSQASGRSKSCPWQ